MTMLHVDDEVREALEAGRAVVALESTIFSNLGLPSPANVDALTRCLAAIRTGGAVPALTAVLDGVARVGIPAQEHDRILGAGRKAAARDLPVAIAERWEFGATTVSASLALAARVGIDVFATGGIGGVHRDATVTGDISADLDALATFPLVTVCAGAKSFLDLARTMEHLEATSVVVLGWQSDELPAFTAHTSGLPVPHRVETAADVAAVFTAARSLGSTRGVLVTVPLGEGDAVPADVLDAATTAALDDAAANGIEGPAVTPFVLARIAEATAGRSVPANLALAEQNAAVAASIAVAMSSTGDSERSSGNPA